MDQYGCSNTFRSSPVHFELINANKLLVHVFCAKTHEFVGVGGGVDSVLFELFHLAHPICDTGCIRAEEESLWMGIRSRCW